MLLLQNLKRADLQFSILKSSTSVRNLHVHSKSNRSTILIAVVNCVLSVIALWILGFPQLLGLALMIFLLGLIPVAGVIISLFPLCMIAYNIGGIMYVVYILVIVTVIHALESYVLNPKFMSQNKLTNFLYVYGINLLRTL